jgi:hypothetical protein
VERAGQLPPPASRRKGGVLLASKRVHSALTVPERSTVRDLLDAYHAAFEAFDVPAIAALFSYPCQVTGDAGGLAVTTVATREAWIPQIDGLVAAYRAIGARAAEVLELEVTELAPRLAQATVH